MNFCIKDKHLSNVGVVNVKILLWEIVWIDCSDLEPIERGKDSSIEKIVRLNEASGFLNSC